MAFRLILIFIAVSTTAVLCNENASATFSFWKGTILDSHIQKMRIACGEKDTIACLQYNAFKFLDGIFRRDYFQIGDNIQIKRNNYDDNEISSRSYDNIEDSVEAFIKTHDVTFNLPVVGQVVVDSTSLDNEEIGIKWKFGSGEAVEGRKKKHKIRKILSPILIFILLKAITLVPFALGVLGLKAWNGLQLAFISFIISAGLAIFQLCQKLATDHAHTHAHIASAGPWESVSSASGAWGRTLDGEDVQRMAYSAYAR